MAFRFVHTADLHLDSPLRSLALRDPDLAALIGTATRTALERIVTLCLEEQVDALLIAGDLYDGDQTSMKTARALSAALGRLAASGIPTLMIRGNHDAAARITPALELPEAVHIFGARPGTRRLDGGGVSVAVHGVSFARSTPEAPLARFPGPVAGAVNIGMLHTSLGGAPGHDPYAPVSLSDLAALGYDYWALGHLHARVEHPGPPHVVMPGMPQGRDIGEAGAKSVTLATLHPDGRIQTEPRPVAAAEFARAELSLAGVDHWSDIAPRLARGLAHARSDATADHLVLRVRLNGATPLAWRLRRDADALAALAREAAPPALWIETVEPACTPPSTDAPASALDELTRLLDAPPAPALTAEAEALWDELIRALPPELRDSLAPDPDTAAANRAALMTEGIADVLAHLHTAEDPQP